jgi:hypothetical protein
MSRQEVGCQLRDILRPQSKGWDAKVHAAETVVEIRTKQPLLDQFGQRTIRRDDDARVDTTCASAPDALNSQVLYGPEKLRLRRQG